MKFGVILLLIVMAVLIWISLFVVQNVLGLNIFSGISSSSSSVSVIGGLG